MHRLPLEDVSFTNDLLPFTATRSVLEIRMGILTLREKWSRLLGDEGFARVDDDARSSVTAGNLPASGHPTPKQLAPKQTVAEQPALGPAAPKQPTPGHPALPTNILPTRALAARVREERARGPFDQHSIHRLITHGRLIRYPWHIFQYNAEALIEDFDLLTAGRRSQPVPATVQTTNPAAIFIEAGARLGHCILNASTGPIYVGRNAEIMEGALIRGPFAACEGAVVKMGAKIYGATTLGPYCSAGGEIKNTVFFGYSNKGHDGYLGDAVIGEWCNLGAGTSASNLKNNASTVRVWHPASKSYLEAGLKCGLLMGDYSRTAINTSFDTGTVTGVSCNIFGTGTPPKYIPDFSWGADGSNRYEWDKAIRDIASWKELKKQPLTENQILTLKHIFDSRI